MKLDYLFSMTFLQSPFTWETNLSPLQVHRVYFTIFYRSIPQDFFKIPWGNTIILYLLIKINENEKRPRERIFFTDFLQSPFTWKKTNLSPLQVRRVYFTILYNTLQYCTPGLFQDPKGAHTITFAFTFLSTKWNEKEKFQEETISHW